jgi:delta 1-pyrroline-5-carboxylate dehydrogenase
MSEQAVCSAVSLSAFLVERPVVVVACSLLTAWLFQHVWNALHVWYNLQLLYEHLFVTAPTIQLENLPKTVTQDKYEDSSELSRKRPKNNRIDSKKGFIQCFDPSTQEYLGEVPAMTAVDVERACGKASAAQDEWRKTTFAQRRQVLRTLQQYICANVATICRVAARDSGKPVVDAGLGEVLTTTEKIRTIVAAGELWLRPDYRNTGPMFLHKTARVEYVPLGVIAPIAPWNYPYVFLYYLNWC